MILHNYSQTGRCKAENCGRPCIFSWVCVLVLYTNLQIKVKGTPFSKNIFLLHWDPKAWSLKSNPKELHWGVWPPSTVHLFSHWETQRPHQVLTSKIKGKAAQAVLKIFSSQYSQLFSTELMFWQVLSPHEMFCQHFTTIIFPIRNYLKIKDNAYLRFGALFLQGLLYLHCELTLWYCLHPLFLLPSSCFSLLTF